MKTGALRAPAEAAESPFSLDTLRGREAFVGLRAAWNEALAAGPDATPALDHDVLRLWLESFASGANPATVSVRDAGRLLAAQILVSTREVLDLVPTRVARAATNAHSTRGGPLLGADGLAAIPALVRGMMAEPWDVLVLRDVPREPAVLEALSDALVTAGCRTLADEPMESPYVPLPPSWDELEQRLDSRFRQNLRRRRRRLEEQGPVTFEVITGLDGLDAALEDAFAIEASGWKGEEGSAIRTRAETVSFYAGWARHLARDGRLRLCFLKLGMRRIAFHFAYVAQGRYWLPKCGYEETHRECSPGQLLMVHVLQHCIEERIETFEFLGHSMTWKRDWTPLVHPHATLRAYRPTWPGRAAWAMRAKVRPLAAEARRRWNAWRGTGA